MLVRNLSRESESILLFAAEEADMLCSLMAESQGAAGHIWSSLKHSLSLRRSQDTEPDLKEGSCNHAGKAEVLSAPAIDNLPPLQLQNGSAAPQQHIEQPGKEERRSSSWIRRLSVRRRSSELPESREPSGRLASGDLHTNGGRGESLSSSSTDLGNASKQNGLAVSSVAPEREAEGSETRQPSSKAPPGSREAFLEAYDAATLEMCNKLAGTSATSIGDTAFQDVAPWNRESGYLVRLSPWRICSSRT